MKMLQIYLSDLKEVLESRDFVSVRTLLKQVSPVDLADAWSLFTPDERAVLFRLSPRQRALQLFEEIEPKDQEELIGRLQKEDVQDLLQDLDPSRVGRLARELPDSMVRHLSAVLKKGGVESIQRYLQYPPQTVGALMRGRFVSLDPRWNTHQALERIQHSTRLRHIEETHLDTLMIVGPDGKLAGTVGLKTLVVAPQNMAITELMNPKPHTLAPEMDQEEAVKLFKRYKLKNAPVVDATGGVLGLVLYGDVFEVASAETEEDFAKMAGVGSALIDLSAWRQVKLRLPWLVITCLGGLVVSSVIKHFEGTLAQIIALATFSPLIAGMGGNVGSQTATIVVRGLATGEIKLGKGMPIILKEISVGLMLGVFYGVVIGLAAFIFYGSRYGWRFSVVVGLAMSVSIIVSACLAAVEPFLLTRFGIDPATATGPLITTTTDLLSNVAYFGLATALLL